MHKRIGVIIADDMEYLPLLEAAKKIEHTEGKIKSRPCVTFKCDDAEVCAVKCGIGKVNAAAFTAFLIDAFNPDTIVSIGLSGAVARHRKGDLVAGVSYVECDFDLTALGMEPGRKSPNQYIHKADKTLLDAALAIEGVTEAVCGCGDFFLADKALSDKYRRLFGITEFDMETGAVASVCGDAGLPFIAIRHISDNADDAAADSYEEMNNRCEKTLTEVLFELVGKLNER